VLWRLLDLDDVTKKKCLFRVPWLRKSPKAQAASALSTALRDGNFEDRF
jgi:hypothetical protein